MISSSVDVFSESPKIFGALLKTYKKTKDKLKDEIEETIESERKLLTSFEKLCALIPEGKNIYIFIDELDRCSPEETVKIVESLKKYFYGKDILYEDILDRQEEKRNNTSIKVIKFISKYIIFEIIAPLFYSTNKILRKKNKIDISSVSFKYILAIDEGYVAKAFASRYKLNKSDAMNYLSKFIQYRYYIKDYDWSKLIKNVISRLNVDKGFWTVQHIMDVNHILINAFRVYNPRTVKKIISRIILHQSTSKKTYQERRKYLKRTFHLISGPKTHIREFIFEENILRSANVFWVIDSCINELFQSDIKWYLDYKVFEKLSQTSKLIDEVQKKAQSEGQNWAILFLNNNYQIPESELKQDNGKVRKNVELIAFSINQSIVHVNNICSELNIDKYRYSHEYFKRLFNHIMKNEWDQINEMLFEQ